ncbi:quinolinate synthase NadA [Corynebacterium ammoniagenes]|uniref:Quinolinate synthase n=2 Tax=Corynebacterium ammoniagenes TaxID=1697 RepID=A0AAV5G7I2_CORAM|nr:quinolinate synthase NadA [Corynebacterium ammoniagenes]NMF32013.1 quinolinate synthase NadA [Corynebacterium ammoniagenes]GJN43277.1 quinolinate synthase A [Corynebacterium ammoniagenes]
MATTLNVNGTNAASGTSPRSTWSEEVRVLARERNAVILAHNYQLPEIQDIADHVGDSLGLSRIAAETDADEVIFCGVHFMAETAKILSPEKRVFIPDANAGCSLADTINADQLREWKAQHPGAIVVSYVNTTAEVKALTDVCCTSSNAADVVRSIDPEQEILFLPDQFLGAHVRRVTGRNNIHVWAGECHVHADISPSDLVDTVRANTDAELYIHPECGCTTSALWMAESGEIPGNNTHILSTGGMLEEAKKSTSERVLVATEIGMLHQLRKANPTTEFLPVNPQAACPFMQMITPEKLLKCLREGTDEVFVDKRTADAARTAVERMIAIGNPGSGE